MKTVYIAKQVKARSDSDTLQSNRSRKAGKMITSTIAKRISPFFRPVVIPFYFNILFKKIKTAAIFASFHFYIQGHAV